MKLGKGKPEPLQEKNITEKTSSVGERRRSKRRKRRIQLKKTKKMQPRNLQLTFLYDSSSMINPNPIDVNTDYDVSKKESAIDHIPENQDSEETSNNLSGFSTPKGEEFRIPKMLTCPPAPAIKRRLVLSDSNTNSPRSSPTSVFAPTQEIKEIIFVRVSPDQLSLNFN